MASGGSEQRQRQSLPDSRGIGDDMTLQELIRKGRRTGSPGSEGRAAHPFRSAPPRPAQTPGLARLRSYYNIIIFFALVWKRERWIKEKELNPCSFSNPRSCCFYNFRHPIPRDWAVKSHTSKKRRHRGCIA